MGHDHGNAPPASRRVRRLLALALAPFVLLTLAGLVLLWPDRPAAPREGLGVAQDTVRGTVESVRQTACAGEPAPGGEAPGDEAPGDEAPGDEAPGDEAPGDEAPGENAPGEHAPGGAAPGQQPGCAEASVRLTSGADEGRVVPLTVAAGEGSLTLERGMKLVLGVEPEAPPELRYRVVDVQRDRPMLLLALLFAAAVVALGRWRGVAALGGLAVSLLVLVKFVLPAFLTGASPLPVAVVGAAAIMFVAIFLAHGFTARSSVALLGTLASLVITGLLAAGFVAAGHFTGLATEEANFIRAVYGQVDVHGLLLAGVIIGSLGVLDDVTVTQATAIWELRRADPDMTPAALYRAGVRIGRDHIASTVNTLVLAYAGASLPLLLLFAVSGVGVGTALTSEVIAQEVVRTLVGSIGLVASVPITTALAAFVATRDAPAGGAAADDETEAWLREVRQVWRDRDGDPPARPSGA